MVLFSQIFLELRRQHYLLKIKLKVITIANILKCQHESKCTNACLKSRAIYCPGSKGVLMQQIDFDYKIVIGKDRSIDNTRAILLHYQQEYLDKICFVAA